MNPLSNWSDNGKPIPAEPLAWDLIGQRYEAADGDVYVYPDRWRLGWFYCGIWTDPNRIPSTYCLAEALKLAESQWRQWMDIE